MEAASPSLGWLKQPAFLVSLATAVTFYAGWSRFQAKLYLAHVPRLQIHLEFHEYIMLGAFPTVVFLVPLLLAWLTMLLGTGSPGPKLVTFVVVYPVIVIAASHVIDGDLVEASLWSLSAAGLGWIWWRRARQKRMEAARDWFLRIPYVVIVLLAVGHVGTATGYLTVSDETTIIIEMVDPDHPLHNQTMILVFHDSGNYYLREPGAKASGVTFIVSDSAVSRVIVTA